MQLHSAPALVLLVGAFPLAGRAGAQIFTENAGVISPETPILRESVSFFDAEHASELRWIHQLILATEHGREFKLAVPFVRKELESTGGSGQQVGHDMTGLGDVSLRFKQSVWQRDDVMASTRWAFLAEWGAPTGEDDATVAGVRLPRRLQLGTGDWGVGAGSAFTWIRDRRRFSAEGFLRHRTRHEGVHLGSSADLNLAYWHRLAPARFSPEEQAQELRGVLELLSSYRFESELGSQGAGDEGTLVWLAPGVQYYPGKRVLFELGLQVPVFQDVEDALGERHWTATAVIKFLF